MPMGPRRTPEFDENLVDISDWDRRNMLPLSSGELAVRPGLKEIKARSGSETFKWGASIRSDVTGEVWHYVVGVQSPTATLLDVTIYDDDWQTIQYITVPFGLSGDAAPNDFSIAHVGNELLLGGPGVPTLWGYVGGPLYRAYKQTTYDPDAVSIDVPRGNCVGWAGRAVVTDGTALYISDAARPRAFNPINALNPPGGSIMQMHVSGAGDLYICTDTGVWRLPFHAATAGNQVLATWQKVTDYRSATHHCTGLSRGRLWGLTEGGLRLIDTEGGQEVPLSEPMVPMTVGPRISSNNFGYEGRVIGGYRGPIVSLEAPEAACIFDDASGAKSWWTYSKSTGFKVRAVLEDQRGREMYLTDLYVLRATGNHDTGGGSVDGVVVGRLRGEPAQSTVLREVHVATDAPATALLAVRGNAKTGTVPQSAPVEGTTAWTTSGGAEPELTGVRIQCGVRSDDLALELGARGPLSRVGTVISIATAGIGRRRPR